MTALTTIANDTRQLVLLTHPLPDWAMSAIKDKYNFHLFDADCEICRQAEVILTSGVLPVDGEILDQMPNIKYICCLGSGIEGIDIPYTNKRGIVVSNSAIITAEDVADHTIAITLSLYCQIPLLDQAVRNGEWPKPVRRSLKDWNVGILGLGAIGKAVARRLEPFGCDIRWSGPREKKSAYLFVPNLHDLAAWADILIVAARADKTNIALIDKDVIDKIGPDGLLVNVSRGSIIDEDALIAALQDGRLGGAALDVFVEEPTPADRWRIIPNVVLTPHVGGFATGVQEGIAKLVDENLDAFFAGTAIQAIISPVTEITAGGLSG